MEQPSEDVILAATAWRTNADLIADALRLHSPSADSRILDVTFGRGNWWADPEAQRVTGHDIRIDGVDFRSLPYDDGSWDVVAYDPPYVSVGGRSTTTLQGGDYHDRYGLADAPRSPADLQRVIDDGLVEVTRVTRPGGIILCKCQDYVSSGRLWIGTYHTISAGIAAGLSVRDRMEHVARSSRPQPGGRRQVHARRNLSTLIVFQKSK